MERFTRESLSHHDPEHHRDFLLEVFLLAQPQSAALEPTEEQQQEEFIEESQTVWRKGINEERQTEMMRGENLPKL